MTTPNHITEAQENDFIREQQDLGRQIGQVILPQPDIVYHPSAEAIVFSQETLDTLITQIITNTGEKLLRLAEGERREQPLLGTPLHTEEYIRGINETIDTIKKHITNVTGVE